MWGWYGQLRGCKNDAYVLLYSVKLVQSKVKFMENLWLIV